MPRIRVYELSKELGVSNKEIINAAKDFGFELKSHASSLEETDAVKIKGKFLKPGSITKESVDSKKKVELKEVKEEVKVFRSESGQEVVERRKGSKVVIRKKKKVKEDKPEPDQPPSPFQIQQDQEDKEPVKQINDDIQVNKDTADVNTVDSEVADSKPIEKTEEKPPKIVELEADTDLDVPKEQLEDSIPYETTSVKEREELKKDRETTKTEIPSEEIDKKVKKKAKKTKPRKEEIIDEDTLEELRRAFRTKLPTRKKEYVVEDRKFRNRAQNDVSRRQGKGMSKQNNLQIARETGQETPLGALTTSQPAIRQAKRIIKIGELITVGDLAKKMGIKAGDVIKRLLQLGTPANINQSIDHDTAILLSDEFGFEVEVEKFEESDYLLDQEEKIEAEAVSRPPVVTVMGHVDHGKTTLLDTIRQSSVVEGEAGGITQHIGSYKVTVNDSTIVFVDTPGHEAFTSMRARGASLTDIVILVVAADDGVMPQTVEAINHAKAANVPIIVAINKIDKDESDPEKIKRELSEQGLIPEDWGGDVLVAEVSAKTKKGINDLLELILLQADVLELTAVTDKRANGVVVEAKLDKGRGAVATVIVTEGTLKIGDYVVAGLYSGRIRALLDENSKRVEEAGPSIPVEIMGISGVPSAGEKFFVVNDERIAKDVISHRENKLRSKTVVPVSKVSLEDLYDSLEKEEIKELLLVIKADTQGSVEALKDSIMKLSGEKCKVNIVHSGVGAINETDIALASASNAIVVGFNVRPDSKTMKVAEKEGISLELHNIIYDVVSRIKDAMEGLLEPIINELVIGHVDVRETFHISRIGTIAGCFITDGKVSRDNNVRVLRDGVVVYEGKIGSLRRFKEDVKEVQTGYECGIVIENFNDVKVDDVFEIYTFEEIKQEL